MLKLEYDRARAVKVGKIHSLIALIGSLVLTLYSHQAALERELALATLEPGAARYISGSRCTERLAVETVSL